MESIRLRGERQAYNPFLPLHEYIPDGSIAQVEMTSCGLNGGPLRARGEYPAVIACNLTNGRMPHLQSRKSRARCPYITNRGEERFIAGIVSGVRIGYKYFAFSGETELSVKTRGSANGMLRIFVQETGECAGEIAIRPSEGWRSSQTSIAAQGTLPLIFQYAGRGRMDLLSFALAERSAAPKR